MGNPKKKIELIDTIADVSILFADISGFTAYSSTVQPEDVVNMLKEMFTEFDKLCLYHNVYKVYTIGDCYVVLGHTDKGSRNPSQEAINTIEMGFSMIEIIKNVRARINFQGLQMRIGIHTVKSENLNLGKHYRRSHWNKFGSIRRLWKRRSDSKQNGE